MEKVERGEIDLNHTENGSPRQKEKGFPAGIYKRLPRILSDGCNQFTDPKEKAVFLSAALGVVSGLLPNVSAIYDGQTVYPNLYVYILGQYGGGKGAARFARELGMKVHRDKIESTQAAKNQYYIDLEQYKIDLKAWKKLKSGEQPTRPQEPTQKVYYIPANNSKTGVFQMLAENDGAGTLFETEGDTLADATRQDYGNYTDGLRKGFHHEPISYKRRLNNEFVEIENPRISVILSSTLDQLLSLIPTAENGLFSRFLFYQLPLNPEFRNVFDPEKAHQMKAFRALSEKMAEIFYILKNDPEGFGFCLTDQQKADFLKHFQGLKAEIQQNITHDLDGTINRLGLIFFRIAMILTVLRKQTNKGEVNQDMYCTDNDFQLTMEIIETLKDHAISVYLQLPEKQLYNSKHLDKADNVTKAIELHRGGASYSNISQAIFGSETHKSTVYRWINQ